MGLINTLFRSTQQLPYNEAEFSVFCRALPIAVQLRRACIGYEWLGGDVGQSWHVSSSCKACGILAAGVIHCRPERLLGHACPIVNEATPRI